MSRAAVRPATPDDAATVAALQLEVWRDAYAELLPASVLLGDPAVLAQRWAVRIRDGGPVLLAVEGSAVVGMAALDLGPVGPDEPDQLVDSDASDASDEAVPPIGDARAADSGDRSDSTGGSPSTGTGTGEIEQLLVLPRWSRRGHGGRLLGEAGALLRRAGRTRGIWWAPEPDRSVERFLAGVQWFPDGARRAVDTGEGVLAEVRYAGGLDLVVL
ncbi:GNAT family N-acetyltransferase [Nakamurella endophytica]|uniref:GNAT family N-acetyltransferase n=1 Tax=Nakamurella endophytica TaxID=1748367 RepID=A0A917WDV5_9ACTN|nr:GNAT family N-acetyltransferase [Nakamurella endophytica]GGL95414.1 hypothetical protein GCM10011594_13780 [Nakamurella endophytica]